MTGHQINSLVGDLVAMAQAMEQLPKVERELDQAHGEIDRLHRTVQAREEAILSYKAEIETLHASIRELEVAKDSAETMFLEADDRTTRALEFVKTMFGSAGSLIQALEPVKPEPDPITAHTPGSDAVQTEASTVSTVEHSLTDPVAQGQGEAGPTHHTKPSSLTHGGETSGEATPHPDKPYVGKCYYDMPTYISYWAWIDGGGTDADYHWRPSF